MITKQIREYESFVADRNIPGYTALPEATFQLLEDFILTSRNQDADGLELMGISYKKGVGRIITAKNNVGVLTLKDKTTIEILPKIYSAAGVASTDKTKTLLVEMLRTLGQAPFKSLQTSQVDVARMPLLEIFIRMFVEEVLLIVKHGLKGSYETREANEAFFKGKMCFAQQIKYNHSHQERAFVAYDVFNSNCPENRLLKAALNVLYGKSTSLQNKRELKRLLLAFHEVEASVDYAGDFAQCMPDRRRQSYQTALLWCRIFLRDKGFTPLAGTNAAPALLFPMEALFESYMAVKLKKRLDPSAFLLTTQDRTYHLFDQPKEFLLKPDIVITRRHDKAVFVLDTKWKRLQTGLAQLGMSQADMYQMYAYQKKYGAKSVTLIYPQTEEGALQAPIVFSAADGARVRVVCVNLLDLGPDLDQLVELFTS